VRYITIKCNLHLWCLQNVSVKFQNKTPLNHLLWLIKFAPFGCEQKGILCVPLNANELQPHLHSEEGGAFTQASETPAITEHNNLV